MTKFEMVKEMFLVATNGIRSVDNFVEGMWVIEELAKTTSKYSVNNHYEKYSKGEVSAMKAIAEIMFWYKVGYPKKAEEMRRCQKIFNI